MTSLTWRAQVPAVPKCNGWRSGARHRVQLTRRSTAFHQISCPTDIGHRARWLVAQPARSCACVPSPRIDDTIPPCAPETTRPPHVTQCAHPFHWRFLVDVRREVSPAVRSNSSCDGFMRPTGTRGTNRRVTPQREPPAMRADCRSANASPPCVLDRLRETNPLSLQPADTRHRSRNVGVPRARCNRRHVFVPD